MATTSLKTDSPVSLSIVASFLQFLSTVEPASGTDTEALEVAAQCLSEVFGLNTSNRDPRVRLLSLADFFTAGLSPDALSAPGSNISAADSLKPSTPVAVSSPSHGSSSAGDSARETPVNGRSTSSGESLLDQFRDGLDLAGFFEGVTKDSVEYGEKINQAKQTLDDALKKVRASTVAPKWSAGYSEDTLALAEAFKTQGNVTMNSQRYQDAIQLYTLAISLCSNNAIFYSNRAAALTQVGKYAEAIADCEVAIKLDPQYSKAYSRLGLVYFAQGRLQEAIEKGFQKALELDPSSASVQENLRAAQLKLEEQQRSRDQGRTYPPGAQNSGNFTASTGGPMNMPLPPEIANLLPGILNLAAQFGQRAQETQPHAGSQQNSGNGSHPGNGGNSADGGVQGDPEVTVNGNINVTVDGQQLPPQYAGLMQSVFQQMFGASPGQNPNTQQPGPPGGN
ncbi:unnamed protein product [Calypogeia fissa]